MNPDLNSNEAAIVSLAATHYENFPVASWLLPRSLRPAVAAIYAFARQADDFADEGNLEPSERLGLLDDYRQKLDQIKQGNRSDDPLFSLLATHINQHNLPWKAFYDLLSAFSQDVTVTRYNTYPDLLDYCSRSANPVGLLLLHLVNRASPELIEKSNAICTALQIINFLQDIAIDHDKGRIYIPLEDLKRHHVNQAHIENRIFDHNWQSLINMQLDRVEQLMLTGADLPCYLAGRMKFEIRATVVSGLRVISLLRHRNKTGFTNQPRLRGQDWVKIAMKTVFYPYK